MSVSFLSIPKNVIIKYIIPHLLYKERIKLYCTCKQLWSMFKPDDDYIYGYWKNNVYYVELYCNRHWQTAYMIYPTMIRDGIGYLQKGKVCNWNYYDKHEDIMRRKLEEYMERFGPQNKKIKITI